MSAYNNKSMENASFFQELQMVEIRRVALYLNLIVDASDYEMVKIIIL